MKIFEFFVMAAIAVFSLYFFSFGREEIETSIVRGKFSRDRGELLKKLVKPMSLIVFLFAIGAAILTYAGF